MVSFTGILALSALAVQNAGIALIMRLAITNSAGFLPSTAVCCDEALKLVVCFVVLAIMYASAGIKDQQTLPSSELQPLRPRGASVLGFARFLYGELFGAGFLEFAKMAVPALLYTVQKNLLYVALNNLHAVVYQVTAQTKILTTAFFSYVILDKRFERHQLLALVLLTVGVICTQLSALHPSTPLEEASKTSALTGILAVQAASMTSGFSSVYFEAVLKAPQKPILSAGESPAPDWSLWVRNIQLGAFALPIALLGAFFKDGHQIRDVGFFHGYTQLTGIVICLEALGGIMVALVTKYADSILKNFALAIAILASSVVCFLFMGFSPSMMFGHGACLVLFSVFLYQGHVPSSLWSWPRYDAKGCKMQK